MTALNLESIDVTGQQFTPDVFPLVYGASSQGASLDDLVNWCAAHKQELLDSLALHGTILFRGFPVVSDLDFDRLIQAFDLPNFAYVESLSNAVRRNRTPRVFTANEAPPSVSIYLHHEMAQTPIFPSRLFFFCEKAAQSGGATPLCRSDLLLRALEEERPEFVEACERLGVRYTNVMPAAEDVESGQGRSWRSTLQAEDKQAAEAKLRSLAYSWEWREDDSLKVTTPVLPAVRTLADGRKVFFNQLIAAFRGWQDKRNSPEKTIRFGDDTPISAQDMDCAIRIGDALSFDMAWKTGDVALIDNFLVMHGRRPFEGERRVLASLLA